MLRFLACALTCIAALIPSIAIARGGGVHSGRSSYRSSGTVHVRAYTRKDGTYVRAHTRSAPGSGGTTYVSPASAPETPLVVDYRQTARTSARTSYRTDPPAAIDDQQSLAIITPHRTLRPSLPTLPAHFKLWLKGGLSHPIVRYEDDGDSWLVMGVTGGEIRYPKDLVTSVDPIGPTTAEVAAAPGGQRIYRPFESVVKRAVDGDTIELENGERVRLVGVDTPETVDPRKPVQYFGQEASRFTHASLDGERIRLVSDQNSAATGHRDHYGRLLAYVFRVRDNLDFNAELVKEGYGHAYVKYPFERMDEFLGYEREAREQGRGLWAPDVPTARGPPATVLEPKPPQQTAPATVEPAVPTAGRPTTDITVYVTRTGTKHHVDGCRYLRSSNIQMKLSDAKQRYEPCSICRPPLQ
ncbi:MAG TPA: thermonuclease family protein [Pirellulales bacterium]|jgi:micrococcal nuclease